MQICQFLDNLEFKNLQSVLIQLSPQECLVSAINSSSKVMSPRFNINKILKTHKIRRTVCNSAKFSAADIVQDLNRLVYFKEGKDFRSSMKSADNMKYALSSLASIIRYLELLGDENNVKKFSLSIFPFHFHAKIDIQSASELALFPGSIKDLSDQNYLLGHLNHCGTSMGERLLVQWIKQPLMDLRKLEERLDIVEIFVNDYALRDETSKIISKFPDIELACRKIHRRKANLQNLYNIYMMLKKLPTLHDTLSKYNGVHTDVLKSKFITDLEKRIEDFKSYTSMIESALDFEALKNNEFVVKAEYDKQLLELRKKINKIQNRIMYTINDAKKDLDSPYIKFECCEGIGYYFRLPRKEKENLHQKRGYVIIDTKAFGVRFQSPLLKSLNDVYISLKKSYEKVEKNVVDQVICIAASFNQSLRLLSHTISWLDVSLSFASVSANAPKPYIRPKLREMDDCCIIMKQARHPILESKIKKFIPNDVELSRGHTFYFVTGPNMGGKSTYIKSVALNVLLAQIGCFVPCDFAEISITDAFMIHIGACYKPSEAESTFILEMVEINSIIKSSTSSSLLIIDKMGQGTYDGFGFSWAISRHIAEKLKSRCLFVTNFRELTELSKSVPSISNLHLETVTSDGDIIFLYHVKPGVCDESCGIHVEKLAKFSEAVIKEAEKKLEIDKIHMPGYEILDKFKNVSGGQVLNILQKTLPVKNDSRLTGSSDNQPAMKKVKLDQEH